MICIYVSFQLCIQYIKSKNATTTQSVWPVKWGDHLKQVRGEFKHIEKSIDFITLNEVFLIKEGSHDCNLIYLGCN